MQRSRATSLKLAEAQESTTRFLPRLPVQAAAKARLARQVARAARQPSLTAPSLTRPPQLSRPRRQAILLPPSERPIPKRRQKSCSTRQGLPVILRHTRVSSPLQFCWELQAATTTTTIPKATRLPIAVAEPSAPSFKTVPVP